MVQVFFSEALNRLSSQIISKIEKVYLMVENYFLKFKRFPLSTNIFSLSSEGLSDGLSFFFPEVRKEPLNVQDFFLKFRWHPSSLKIFF